MKAPGPGSEPQRPAQRPSAERRAQSTDSNETLPATVVSPIFLFRQQHNLSLTALAQKTFLSNMTALRAETGQLEHAPKSLLDFVGLSQSHYQQFRLSKRRAVRLNSELHLWQSPTSFSLWRTKICAARGLKPSAHSFTALLAIPYATVYRFEAKRPKNLKVLVPDSLRHPLAQAGVTWIDPLDHLDHLNHDH